MKKTLVLASSAVILVAVTVLLTLKISSMGRLAWVPIASAQKASAVSSSAQASPNNQGSQSNPPDAAPQKVETQRPVASAQENPVREPKDQAPKEPLACLGGTGRPCVIPQPAARTPIEKSITIALLPGQKINLPNDKFKWVLIHSHFPIRVINGTCSNDYTATFACKNEIPEYIYIEDRRNPPIIRSPESNDVTLTLREF